MINMRTNGAVGIIEGSGFNEEGILTHFNECWSGECISFSLKQGNETQQIDLSNEQLMHIVAIATALGYVDEAEVREIVTKLKQSASDGWTIQP